ncbi:MAG: hypothetical protein JO093_10055 [Acidobacteria bacterium]|nr:hypothetical protein [Acidobacteriota bacterium]MBV9068894.1 hypothetical protein [Acidobacteriota bacterium]MBV9185958.1 hypothetical protein [Acidobacteriota bacterium]
MRVFSRLALVVLAVAVLSASTALADQYQATCPLTLVATNAGPTAFYQSPHGVFRFGSQVFALRGQTLTTYTVTELGDMQIAREDFIGALAARETKGGVAFNAGFLYVSSEAGLEIYDLRSVRAGGTAPILVSRTPGLRYHRLAVSGNLLAALYPATDLPCSAIYPAGGSSCFNQIDIYNIANPLTPVRVGTLSTFLSPLGGYNDIAFNFGILIAAANGNTVAWNLSNPASPTMLPGTGVPGTFLVSNGSTLLGVGNDTSIITYTITPTDGNTVFHPLTYHSTANLQVERANPIIFHPQAVFDESNGRLITMIDELDYQTLQPARTIAFDVFDYATAMLEGRDPRQYEQVSYTQGDEVKWNPLSVGSLVYVVGEMTGTQTYGACGLMTGKIEFDTIAGTVCGGAEIHGWVTGTLKITNVELLLDGGSLGSASLSGPPRNDIPSTTPVSTWRVSANLDAITRGEHVLRAIGTDAAGNRRQFSSQRIFFPGPGSNCVARRRAV